MPPAMPWRPRRSVLTLTMAGVALTSALSPALARCLPWKVRHELSLTLLAGARADPENAEGRVVGLTITSPSPGTVVASGGTIAVTVVPDAGLTIDRMAVAGRGTIATDDASPFVLTLQIPLDEAGAFPIGALGVDSSGQTYVSDEVVLEAVPNATLTSVDLRPDDPVLIGPGASESTFIVGTYDDSVERRVDPNACAFASTSPSVATVASDGTLEAIAAGSTTISVHCDQVTDSEVVTVTPARGSPSSTSSRRLQPEEAPVLSRLPVTRVTFSSCGEKALGRAICPSFLLPR